MINRRIIRIKVFQTAFALFSGGFDLDERFVNSKNNIVVFNQAIDQKTNYAEKFLLTWLTELYKLYFFFFKLLIDLKNFEKEKIQKAMQKLLPTEEDLHPNTKFIENQIINALETNPFLLDNLRQYPVNLPEGYQSFLKELYAKISAEAFFIEYKKNPGNNFNEDKELVFKILNFLYNDDELYDFLENASTYWVDTIDFIIDKTAQSIGFLKPNALRSNIFFTQFRFESDKLFALELLRKSVLNFDGYMPEIASVLKNWDIERINLMDKVLMSMAISEALKFEDIPLSVTIDEYVDISKYYSTPKSYSFINGTLEALFCKFYREGKIKKSGRGLNDKFKYKERCENKN